MTGETNDGADLKGHRSRLRGRLLGDGGDALQDYELLEYLLGLATPRYDTKPAAKDLMREFGSIGGVLSADPAALSRVKGVGDISIAAIKIAQATAVRLLRSEIAARPILANWQALLDYLRARLAHGVIEQFRVLYLDTKNHLIRDEEQSEGTIDQAPVYVREVIKRSLELNAAAIILVHNHPSGDPSPSRADIEITRTIAEAGKRLGIAVHDHIVMGTGGHVSLRAQGLI